MKRIILSLYIPDLSNATKILSNLLEGPLASIVLTGDESVDGKIYPVHNWQFILDFSMMRDVSK